MNRLTLLLCASLAFACDDGGEAASTDSGFGDDGGGAGGEGGAGGAGGEGGTGGVGGEGGMGGGLPEGLSIPGLSAPVTVEFDEHGVLHITCEKDVDCVAAQGYFHAKDRFIQMDIARRFPSGRLSELVGSPTLDVDRASRHIIATVTGERMEEVLADNLDAPSRAAVEAYATGVNAWIADHKAGRNDAVLNDEYAFDLIDETRIDEWRIQDSMASTLLLVRQLTEDSAQELASGEAFAALPADQAYDAYGLRPGNPTTTIPANDGAATGTAKWWSIVDRQPELALARDALEKARLALGRRGPLAGTDFGSNNWVVGPSKSASGNALLSNDPHLGLSNPSVWYLVHMKSAEGLNVAGVSLAGMPGVLIGQNEHIAWGFTTTYFDMSDVYIETLTPDGGGVMFEGDEVPFIEREFTFELSGDEPVVETFRYVPHHGPVLSIDEEAGIAITLRWTGQDADTDGNYILALAKATSVDEAKEALKNLTTIGQNVVVADRGGNIGWFPYNRLPSRPWASAELPPWLPLPGDGSAEWGPSIPYEDLPQLVNPEQAFIATANNDMTGSVWDGDPTNDGVAALQNFAAPGYRIGQITKRLKAQDDHSRDTMNSIMADVHSLVGEQLTPLILASVDGREIEGGEALRAALMAWDFQCPTGLEGVDPMGPASADAVETASASGCSAFHVLYPRLRAAAFADEAAAADYEREAALSSIINLILRPAELSYQGWWDDVSTEDTEETMGDIVAAAMVDGQAFLVDALGEDPAEWRWGRLHTMTMRGNLFADAGINIFDHGPFANDGGLFTVDVGNPGRMGDDKFDHFSGPSMRFACEVPSDASPQCTMQLPGGQRLFRDSPHYDDLLQKWLVNEPIELQFDTHTSVETLTVMPQ